MVNRLLELLPIFAVWAVAYFAANLLSNTNFFSSITEITDSKRALTLDGLRDFSRIKRFTHHAVVLHHYLLRNSGFLLILAPSQMPDH